MRIRGQDVGYDSGLVQPTRRVGPCARSARPRPCLRTLGQPCLHRVPLDITDDPLQLPSVPHPVVKRLVLPKRLSSASQDQVRLAGAESLDGLGDPPQLRLGKQDQMHMVGHEHPCPKLAEPQLLLREVQSADHCGRHSRVSQPKRPGTGGVQLPVQANKLPAGGSHAVREDREGKRAVQAPCQEQGCALGLPMGELAPIVPFLEAHPRKCSRGRYVLQILLFRRKETADPTGRLDKTGVISHVPARTKCTDSGRRASARRAILAGRELRPPRSGGRGLSAGAALYRVESRHSGTGEFARGVCVVECSETEWRAATERRAEARRPP